MNGRIRFYVLCAAFLLLLPMAVRGVRRPQQQPEGESGGTYRVLDIRSGRIETVGVRDYLIGTVAAEMPSSFAAEALKAQAVAAHTYAERIAAQNRERQDPALCGADFSNDPAAYQAFYMPDELRSLWGDAYESRYGNIAAAVAAVSDDILTADGEPIAAAYHAISPGMTESAAEIWGNALPYLVNTDSAGDLSAPEYQTELRLSAETVQAVLRQRYPSVSLPDDPAAWFTAEKRASGGTVLQMQAGNLTLSGQTVRELFGLRSACFEIAYADGAFLFTVKGHGHGVGMSQYGANAMAYAGCDYREILAHYYPGTVLTGKT
ncbi:MAG: stage II sporulation protein D [Oscillospiraceae bacterium]|nr:stage II sporulation protein D [Oscillospiraceae bacterium]